jgi:hypothetical protein
LISCAPGEISWEEQTFGHGVYMHHVLQALAQVTQLEQWSRKIESKTTKADSG